LDGATFTFGEQIQPRWQLSRSWSKSNHDGAIPELCSNIKHAYKVYYIFTSTIRSLCVYTFIFSSRVKPITVIPSSSANRNAKSVGAEAEMIILILILEIFNKTSEETRPLKTMILFFTCTLFSMI